MTISMLACGKAIAFENLKGACLKIGRNYTSVAGPLAHDNGQIKHAFRADESATHRELFMDILSSNATKRDAKQYLARFKPSSSEKARSTAQAAQEEWRAHQRQNQDRLDRIGVNLGGLYEPVRSVAESPQFIQQVVVNEEVQFEESHELHIALVCLKDPELLDEATLDGLASTLAQLVKLDMRIILVLESRALQESRSDCIPPAAHIRSLRDSYAQQAHRIERALAEHRSEGGRLISGAFEIGESMNLYDATNSLDLSLPSLITEPLQQGTIPIIAPLAYTSIGKLVRVDGHEIMTSLTKHYENNTRSALATDGATFTQSVDRIIILDRIGGIPSRDRGDRSHVFINLEQEFEDIKIELSEYAATTGADNRVADQQGVYEKHCNNLEMARDCLAVLPSASSALIITPQEAAKSSQTATRLSPAIGAGTRRQKNTLIHNLLTNKPLVSSSLPAARIAGEGDEKAHAIPVRAPTLIKRGMPLTIIPAADRALGWQAPANGSTPLQLDRDPRIDFKRLVHLINNSFRRDLDVEAYLARITGRIAGVIVAGEYEGGAILTWEMPPGTNDPQRLVPYLDKFAVLQSSQGSSGVADIVFQAMVRSCFPQGVCWRSRQNNPVNKWYFERSSASWKLPSTHWTMFWTGEGIVGNEQRWKDYIAVCENIQPTWRDGKRPD